MTTPVSQWIAEHFDRQTSDGKPLDEQWLNLRFAPALGRLAEHHLEVLLIRIHGSIGLSYDEVAERVMAIEPGKRNFSQEVKWAADQFPESKKSITRHYKQYMKLRAAMDFMRNEFLPVFAALRKGETPTYGDLVSVTGMKDALDAVSLDHLKDGYGVTKADCEQFAMLLESLRRKLDASVQKPVKGRIAHPELGM